MADTTANLNMPFILPSQAQKHVTHNEALLRLDALVHLTIVAELENPPGTSEEGACYLVATAPTGAWAGKTGRIASWQDGYWAFLIPRAGWRAWFAASEKLKVFSGTLWLDIPLPAIGRVDELGINATPDSTNRLTLASPASLFNHAGNGHQIKVNKAASTDTASLLFQSNWTGYAEMGLAGNTEFSVKVSDGTTWKTGLSISPSGRVSQPNQPAARVYRAGTSFTPTAGQQSGFTTLALDRGGFSLGVAVGGGGNRVVVPADGVYLVALNLAVLSSSGHATSLMLNATQTLILMNGAAGGAQMQSATGIFSFSAGDHLTLGHAGTAQLELGAGKTELSLAMLQ
ncbi:Hypothetical protein NGAL_HAMBI1145_25450 [Neorhizobium galegae bv. officinalis]|uniref:DUF2793 domain-containing protein n=1 Tax=Neorhizobium galegae bv. officinalis TaxID=323656 RepID=A0A0T7FIJ9_NEOGA|nr:DUF2793 domain-containing protein [Neorhizobium galegae]CDZ34855.1 Hypothetical protein NGAL_HAMBI1145_25450 [Neorhizobium galegae bv. officinalis]